MRSNDVCYDNPLTPDSDSVSTGMEEAPGSHTDGISGTNSSHDFIFDKEDGDVELQMNNTLFKTRKYLLNKFSMLAKLVRDAESVRQFPASSPTPMPRVVVKCDAQLIGDFNNMTKILYASVIEGPFEFDTATLISALRVATVYRYDALRQFSISNLERAELSAIQRIKIAHELDVAHWTEPAFEELANRLEPIQPEEAQILGIDALLRVANMREERRAHRGDDGNTVLSEAAAMTGSRSRRAPTREPTSDDLSDTEEDAAYCLSDLDDDLLGEKAKTRFIGIPVPPLRVHVPNKSRRQRLEVDFPDCTCTSAEAGNCVTCRIPPCLFKVLRSLQAQQMISSDEIMALQGTMSVLGG